MNSCAMWNMLQISDLTVYDHTNEQPPSLEQMRHIACQFTMGSSMSIIHYHYSNMQAMGWKNLVDKEVCQGQEHC